MTQITYENIANNTITTNKLDTSSVANLQGPRITSITITDNTYTALDDTAVSTSGGYIKITGSNFATGCSVVIGTVNASTVTFTSSTELRVAVPAQSAGTYTVYVTNTDGGLAIKVNGLTYSAFPAWSTSSTLPAGYETTNVNISLTATSDSSITYTVNAGSSLPNGLSLSSAGLLTGVLPAVASDTNYSFVIQATDAELQNTPRTFSLNEQADVVTWYTPSANGTVLTGTSGTAFSQTLLANSAAGYSATYTANSLPSGLSISGNLITGTPSSAANTATLLTANSATSYKTAVRLIYINILVAADPYFYLTTLATHADGPTVITDASTNNFDLTINGTPRANNNTPFATAWSNYLGSGNYLTTASSSSLALGSGNFTIEAWIYLTSVPADTCIIDGRDGTGTAVKPCLFIQQSSSNYMYYVNGGIRIQGGTYVLNSWQHIAVSRSSGSTIMYLNGSQVGSTYSDSNTYLTCAIRAGYFNDGATANSLFGNISNIRIVVGTAVYTTAFTPPTSPLTAIANTQLLTCQSNRFIDNSTNNFAITVSGSPTVQSFNPFNITNTGTDGSMYFNGSSDYISIPYSSAFDYGTGDFTFEAWIYMTSVGGYNTIIGTGTTGGTDFQFRTSTQLSLGSHAVAWRATANSYTFLPYTWYHVAVSRSSGTAYFWVNGTSLGSSSETTSFTAQSGAIYIGRGDGYFTGYMSNVRIIKGSGIYTSAFTPSTSALTAIANTQLLTLQNRYSHNTINGHQDSSTNQVLITSTGTPAAGNFSPFSQTGWSTYFNGTTDAVITNQTATNNISGTTWTIECWFYQTTTSNATHQLIGTAEGLGNWYVSLIVGIDTSKHVYLSVGTSTSTSTETYNYNQWNHIAAVRDGSGVIKLYLNGVATSSTLTADVNSSNMSWLIGETTNAPGGGSYYAWFPGYIRDVRICKGVAVYTGNFTVPSAPLTATQSSGTNISAITGTQCILLTLQNNRYIDNSPQGLTVSTRGTPQITAFNKFAPAAAYTQSAVSGSLYFNGSTDYIQTSSNNLAFGTADFTIEMWVYQSSANSNNGIFQISGTSGGFQANQSTNLALSFNSSSGYTIYFKNTYGYGSIPSVGGWDHLAIVRSSGYTKFYVNGVWQSSLDGTDTTNYTGTYLVIGGYYSTSYKMAGYVSNFKIVNGTALYSSNFTPSSTPVTSNANTVALITGVSTAMTDVTSRNYMITVGTAKVSTARSKYGTGSIFFNGSSDYLSMPTANNLQLNAGDFTIEVWVYLLTRSSTYNCIYSNYSSFTSGALGIFAGHGGATTTAYQVAYNGSFPAIEGGTVTYNTWNHIALVRSSGTLTLYINGVVTGTPVTGATASLNGVSTITYIGTVGDAVGSGYINGYFDDFRITRYARYTSAFTPPTQAFLDK